MPSMPVELVLVRQAWNGGGGSAVSMSTAACPVVGAALNAWHMQPIVAPTKNGSAGVVVAGARPPPSAFSLRGHQQQVQALQREVRVLRWALAQGSADDVIPPMKAAYGRSSAGHARLDDCMLTRWAMSRVSGPCRPGSGVPRTAALHVRVHGLVGPG